MGSAVAAKGSDIQVGVSKISFPLRIWLVSCRCFAKVLLTFARAAHCLHMRYLSRFYTRSC